jgi:hypothetical protein
MALFEPHRFIERPLRANTGRPHNDAIEHGTKSLRDNALRRAA